MLYHNRSNGFVSGILEVSQQQRNKTSCQSDEWPEASSPCSESASQPTKFPIRGHHGHSTDPFANEAELDHGNWTAVWAGYPPIRRNQWPPPNTTRASTDPFWFFPGPHPRKLRGSGIGLNQFRFKFWFSWSIRIFKIPLEFVY